MPNILDHTTQSGWNWIVTFPIPFKVIGDRVLPMVSLIGILTYWALGLAVPNLENIPQGSFSKCTSPAGRLGGA